MRVQYEMLGTTVPVTDTCVSPGKVWAVGMVVSAYANAVPLQTGASVGWW